MVGIYRYDQNQHIFKSIVYTTTFTNVRTVDHVVVAVPLGVLKAGKILFYIPNKQNPTEEIVDAIGTCPKLADAIHRAGMSAMLSLIHQPVILQYMTTGHLGSSGCPSYIWFEDMFRKSISYR